MTQKHHRPYQHKTLAGLGTIILTTSTNLNYKLIELFINYISLE